MRTDSGEELVELDIATLERHIQQSKEYRLWYSIWELTEWLFSEDANHVWVRYSRTAGRYSVQVKTVDGVEILALDSRVRELMAKEENVRLFPTVDNIYEYAQLCIEMSYTDIIKEKACGISLPNGFWRDKPPIVEYAVYGWRIPQLEEDQEV